MFSARTHASSFAFSLPLPLVLRHRRHRPNKGDRGSGEPSLPGDGRRVLDDRQQAVQRQHGDHGDGPRGPLLRLQRRGQPDDPVPRRPGGGGLQGTLAVSLCTVCVRTYVGFVEVSTACGNTAAAVPLSVVQRYALHTCCGSHTLLLRRSPRIFRQNMHMSTRQPGEIQKSNVDIYQWDIWFSAAVRRTAVVDAWACVCVCGL